MNKIEYKSPKLWKKYFNQDFVPVKFSEKELAKINTAYIGNDNAECIGVSEYQLASIGCAMKVSQ